MIKGFLVSFFKLSRQILLRKKPDVILYYPQLFNRSKEGENPYFKSIINLCNTNNIKYLVLEEPAYRCGFPRNPKSIPADSIYWFVGIFHKILIKGFKMSLHDADKRIGKLLDFLSFHQLRAKTFITISNSMIDVLGEINPYGDVYDFQHGIIYFGHTGYFLSPDKLRPEFLIKNRRVLLWGDLYKNNLKNLPGGLNSEEKFIVVGYPMYKRIEMNELFVEKIILVSLQFTSDISKEVSSGIFEMLDEFASEATSQGYTLILKHHPRFNNEVDLNPLLEKYKGSVEISTESIDSLSTKIKLHVTWGSTTAFEYAAYGIPTYFLRDERLDWATEIFYGQYKYPMYNNMSASEVLERIDSYALYHEDRAIIKEWYESAYSPFNDELMVKILKGEINGK